jgi:hypothetical protein
MTSSFPTLWKTGLLFSAAKTGGPAQLTDFRLIGVLPVLSKVMERLLFEQLVGHLTASNMLSMFQSGDGLDQDSG